MARWIRLFFIGQHSKSNSQNMNAELEQIYTGLNTLDDEKKELETQVDENTSDIVDLTARTEVWNSAPVTFGSLVDGSITFERFFSAQAISAKWYGAEGDGDDDTTALQTVADKGGVITLPPGTYTISAPINFTVPNTKFVGAGAGRTVINAKNGFTGSNLFNVSAANVSFENLKLDGRQSVLLRSDAYDGIKTTGATNCQVIQCEFVGFSRSGVNFTNGSHDCRVALTDVSDVFRYVGASGILSTDSKRLRVSVVSVKKCNKKEDSATNGTDDGSAVTIGAGCDGTIIQGLIAEDCGRSAINVKSSNVTVDGVNALNCQGSILQVGDSAGVENVEFANIEGRNGTTGLLVTKTAKHVYTTNCVFVDVDTGYSVQAGQECTFIGGSVRNAKSYGVFVQHDPTSTMANESLTVLGVSFRDCGNVNAKNVVTVSGDVTYKLLNMNVSHCRFSGNDYRSIYLGLNTDNVILLGNKVSSNNNPSAPIFVDAGVTNIVNSNNQIV